VQDVPSPNGWLVAWETRSFSWRPPADTEPYAHHANTEETERAAIRPELAVSRDPEPQAPSEIVRQLSFAL
jgi:hypothetical protein